MTRRRLTRALLVNQEGAITAEFALILPSVAMMIAFAMSVGAVQLQSFRLLASLSWAAREAAVSTASESFSSLQKSLVEEVQVIAASNRVAIELEKVGDLICARGSVPIQMVWATLNEFRIEQQFCARDQAHL